MDKPILRNWIRYCLSIGAVSGMLFLGSCGDNRNDRQDELDDVELAEGEEYDMDNEMASDIERTSNMPEEGMDESDMEIEEGRTANEYNRESMGTASTNRQKMEPQGAQMSDQEYEAMYKKYSDVNKEIRDELRTYDAGYTYTDNYKSEDGSRGFYGVIFYDLEDEGVRTKLRDLERQRTDMRNKMRGKMDNELNAYLAAEEEAVPKIGYDEFMDYLEDEIDYPTNAAAAEIEGVVMVEFVVTPEGNVRDVSVMDGIDGQTEPIKTLRNPTRLSEEERKEAIREMEQEAVRAVKTTDGMWEPAEMADVPVPMVMEVPVRFRIANI